MGRSIVKGREGVSGRLTIGSLFAQIEKIKRFAAIHIRLFRDGMEGRWLLYAAIIVSDFVAALCQGMVLGTIVGASHLVSSGGQSGPASELMGVLAAVADALIGKVHLSPSALVFYAASVISATLLAISVGAVYAAEVLQRRLVRSYHERTLAQLLRSFVGDTQFEVLAGIRGIDRVQLSLMQHSVHASLSLQSLSRVLQATAFTMAYFLVAFAIERRIMTLMLLCSILFLPVLVLVARRIHSTASSFYDSTARSMGHALSQLLRSRADLYLPDTSGPDQVAPFMRSAPVGRYLDDFDSIQLAAARMTFLTGLVRAGIFGLGLILMTTAVALGWADTTIIVAFMGALFVAFAYLQALFGRIVGLNLHYPQLVRLYEVLDRMAPEAGAGERKAETVASGGEGWRIRRTLNGGGAGSLASVDLRRGSVVDLLTADPLSRYNMGRWLEPIRRATTPTISGSDVAFLADRIQDLAPLSLQALDRGLEARGLGNIEAEASALGLAGDLAGWCRQERIDPGATLGGAALKEMPNQTRALLCVLAGAASRAAVVFIEAQTIAKLPQEALQHVRRLFRSKLLFVWRRPATPAPLLMDAQVVLGAGGLLALFDGSASDAALRALLPKAEADAPSVDDLGESSLLFR